MNKNKFDSLTPEQQQILTEEAKSYVEKQRALELEDNKKAIEKLATEGGLQVNELSEEQKQAFKDALKPMYEEYSQKFSKELFEKSDKYNK